MFSYIEHLRKAPIQKRRNAVLFWTSIIVLIIVLVWFFSLFYRLSLEETESPQDLNPGIQAPYG